MKRVALAIALLMPCGVQAQDGIGRLEIELSPTEITIGDRVEARLILTWTGPEPAAEPEFPTWQGTWGDAEILSSGEVVTPAGLTANHPGSRHVYHQTLVLTAFTTGEIRLPEVAVALPFAAQTIEITSDGDVDFNVRSVLPDDAAEIEPRPAAPPRELAGDRRFAWTAAALAAFSLLLAWRVASRKYVRRSDTSRTPATPLAELLRRLRGLDPAAAEPAHTGLSFGLRNFLGRRLGFAAAESTTTEIERRLRRARLEPETADTTVRLLRDCDLVKFAGMPVTASVTRKRLRQARDLGARIESALGPQENAS